MTYSNRRPSPWLLAPTAAALTLFGLAYEDAIFPSLCLLCVAGAYLHTWSLPQRHPWLVSLTTCAALFCLCALYRGAQLVYSGVMDVDGLWRRPWLANAAPLLQAGVLPWIWHIPRRSTGLVFACLGAIAITSGAILPASYGVVNLYALLGGACLLSLFALSGALHSGRQQPLRERCRQSAVILVCIAIIGAGAWCTSAGLQRAVQALDTLLPSSYDVNTVGMGNWIHIAHRRQARLSRRVVATLSGNRSPLYLRTQVLTHYHRQRWTSPPTPPIPSVAHRHLPAGARRSAPDANHHDVRLHANLQGVAPLPYGAAWVQIPEPLSCLQMAGATMSCSPPARLTSYAYEWVTPRVPIPFGIGFAVAAMETDASLSATAPAEVLAQLRPLARRIVGADATRAMAAAQRLQQHFRTQHTYSLDVDLSPEGDPIVDFVRQRRPAYCEYFASGMALMLRALGVPARVVGGFRVWEYNAPLQQWIVRRRDAHAWVEVYDDVGQRWVGFDATPAYQQERYTRAGLWGWWDQSRAWAELRARSIADRLYQIDAMASLQRWRRIETWPWPMIIRGLILLAFIAIGHRLWRAMPRRLTRRQRGAPALDPSQAEAQAHFARLATFLQQRGAPIAATETLAEYLERHRHGADIPPTCMTLLAAFSHAYHQLRFHPESAAEANRARLLTLRHAAGQLRSHWRAASRLPPHPDQLAARRHNSTCTTSAGRHRTSSAQSAADDSVPDRSAGIR